MFSARYKNKTKKKYQSRCSELFVKRAISRKRNPTCGWLSKLETSCHGTLRELWTFRITLPPLVLIGAWILIMSRFPPSSTYVRVSVISFVVPFDARRARKLTNRCPFGGLKELRIGENDGWATIPIVFLSSMQEGVVEDVSRGIAVIAEYSRVPVIVN